MSAPIVPIWQRPATWNRSLPRDWQGHEALTGAARKRPSRARRAFGLLFGIALAVWIFFLLNVVVDPRFWTEVLGMGR